MATIVHPMFEFRYSPTDAVSCSAEYDDVTLDIACFIIDNPGAHHVKLTVVNAIGTVRNRETTIALNDFRWDPAIAARVQMRTRKGITVLGVPDNWSVSMAVDN